jgi:RNA polymerase subunit RPABC4/transcription elongation factor Spt4
MSRFKDELRVIPTAARVIAAIGYVAMTIMLAVVVTCGHDRDLANAPGIAKLFLIVIPGVFVAIYVSLVGYVFGDARRRGMRYVMWTLLAIFIPNAIGIILYFILRDPPMRACPNCSRMSKGGFAFCPACGTSLLPTCPNCGRGVERGWANCPQCGTKLPDPGSSPASSGSVPPAPTGGPAPPAL